jgi:hypothetical protein
LRLSALKNISISCTLLVYCEFGNWFILGLVYFHMCIFISRHQESSTMFRAFIRICWSSQTNHVFTTQVEVGAELRVSVLGPLTLVWMTFLCSLQVMEWGYWQWTMLIHSLGILHLIISRRATSRPAPYQHHLRPQTPRREMSVHWVICEWTLVVHPELWLFSSWSWMFLVHSHFILSRLNVQVYTLSRFPRQVKDLPSPMRSKITLEAYLEETTYQKHPPVIKYRDIRSIETGGFCWEGIFWISVLFINYSGFPMTYCLELCVAKDSYHLKPKDFSSVLSCTSYLCALFWMKIVFVSKN